MLRSRILGPVSRDRTCGYLLAHIESIIKVVFHRIFFIVLFGRAAIVIVRIVDIVCQLRSSQHKVVQSIFPTGRVALLSEERPKPLRLVSLELDPKSQVLDILLVSQSLLVQRNVFELLMELPLGKSLKNLQTPQKYHFFNTFANPDVESHWRRY